MNAFEAIFTARVWSIRGFIRSCIASLVVVTILFGVWYSRIPDECHLRIVALGSTQVPNSSTWYLIAVHGYGIDIGPHGEPQVNPTQAFAGGGKRYVEAMSIHRLDVFVVLPFLYNFIADFAALIFTQVIPTHLSNLPAITIRRITMTFFLSGCVLLALSFFALDAAVTIMDYIIRATSPGPAVAPPQGGGISNPGNFAKALLFPFYKRDPNEWDVGTLYGTFVWSTLTGILWLGLFSTSVIIANISMKLRTVGPWLSRNFRVQSQPFRILGALMVILVFSVCVLFEIL